MDFICIYICVSPVVGQFDQMFTRWYWWSLGKIIHHTTTLLSWLLCDCCVALMMLISPIIVIGFCSGVEDWGHLWATPTTLWCFVKIDDELAWLITKEGEEVRYIVMLCVIMTTSSQCDYHLQCYCCIYCTPLLNAGNFWRIFGYFITAKVFLLEWNGHFSSQKNTLRA
jgi:hypothetical protein